MKPTASKTFEVIKWTLHLPMFSQRMVSRNSGISLGHVNNVFQWLESNNFIERIRKNFLVNIPEDIGVVRYRLSNPTGILRAISFSRFMNNNLCYNTSIDINKNELIGYPRSKEVVLSLDTALEHYDSYFRGDAVCCYIDSINVLGDIQDHINNLSYGLLKFRIYTWDFKLDITDPMNSMDGFTTELQTIIDLFCDNKAYQTKELLKKRWNIEL